MLGTMVMCGEVLSAYPALSARARAFMAQHLTHSQLALHLMLNRVKGEDGSIVQVEGFMHLITSSATSSRPLRQT